MPAGSCTAGTAAIRKRATQKMKDGPVTGWYGNPATRSLLEDILADDEEHADDSADLLGL